MVNASKVLLSAGEASGDLHAAALLRELRARRPSLSAVGLGGERLRDAGAELTLEYGELALIGFAEAVRRLGEVRRALGTLEAELDSVDAVICVDFSGFNKRLAARAARRGVPVVYYICPKVWVWGAWRAAGIARRCSLMLTIFPFEAPLWRHYGVAARYVGNPILDYLPAPAPPGDPRRVAVLPGSRTNELCGLLPVLDAAARLLRRRRPGLRFVVPSAAEDIRRSTREALAALPPGSPLEAVDGGFHEEIAACGLALVSSGTASLEVACLGVPQVLVYRVNTLTALFARAFIRLPWVGLPNLVAERTIVPELLQERLTPANLAGTADELLASPGLRAAQRSAGLEVRRRLGGPGAARRAAAAVLELFGRPS